MNKKKKRTQREGKERSIDREEKRGLGNCLLDQNSSVDVGYGFYAIHSKLLIANDMYWVVL